MRSTRDARRLGHLLDMDGVLVNSTDAQLRGWGRWAESVGVRVEPFVTSLGLTAGAKIQRFAPHLDVEAEAARVAAMEEEELDGVVALPGAAKMLALDVATAIVTSATRGLVEARMTAAKLVLPDVVVTAETVLEGKPSPMPYLVAAAQLGVPSGQCVVFEDAPAGVLSGKRAGARVVALTTSVGRGRLPGADEYARDLDEYMGRHW